MDTRTIIECLALVLSNLALVPAIYLAFKYRLLPEANLMLVVFVGSILYHLCQVNFVCVLELEFKTLQLMDNFFVYSLLTWIILWFIGLKLEERFIVFVWFQLFQLPLILDFVNTWWLASLFIIFLVFVTVFLVLLVLKQMPQFHRGVFFFGLLLVLVGFGFHIIGGEPSQPKNTVTPEVEHYAIYHSIWHIFSMLGIYFAIDLKQGKSWLAKRFSKIGRWAKAHKKKSQKKTPKKRVKQSSPSPRKHERDRNNTMMKMLV